MDMRDKKIAVIGVGGVGGYLAGMLLQAFPHVTLAARGERGRSIEEHGLVLHSEYKGEKVGRPEKVVSSAEFLEPQDYIFVCVKNYSLEGACREMADAVTDETVIIPVMNGVDAGDRVRELLNLSEADAGGVCHREDAEPDAGSVCHREDVEPDAGEARHQADAGDMGLTPGRKATVVDSLIYIVSFARPDYSIEQQGQFANLRIGIQNADERQKEKVEEVSRILTMADIDYKVAEDIRREIWKKYILNCAYNVATAYYDNTIGQLRTDPEKAKLYEQLIREACEVARAKGVGVPESHVDTVIRKFYNDYGDDATSSLQRDIRDGKPSELETFSGYLVREAGRLGIRIPASERMYEGLKEKTGG